MSRHKTLLTFVATIALGLFIAPVMAQQTQTVPQQPSTPSTNGLSGMSGMSGQSTTTSPPASLSIPVAPPTQAAPNAAQVNPAGSGTVGTQPSGMAPSDGALPKDTMSPANTQPPVVPSQPNTQPNNGMANPGVTDPQQGMTPATPNTSPGAADTTPGTDGGAPDLGAQPAPSEDPYASDTQGGQDEMSIDEIPDVTMIALTPDKAKHAVDLSLLIQDKYKDVQPENYATWQELVDKDPQGKAFEADVKAAGFNTADDVSDALTTVSIVYTYITDPQTQDFKQQIEAVKNDPELTPEMRDKIVAKLTMYIPSEDNIKVIRDLMADPAYVDKLKQLEADGE